MLNTLKTYVKVLARHQRIIIFIDGQISEPSLRNMMEANLHIWGGRYNPIVPVQDNVISEEWLEIIKYYDPDCIYHSKNIEVEFLESLNLFYPRGYIEIRDNTDSYFFPGVNTHCLIHDQVHNRFQTNQSILLHFDGDWDMRISAKQFFQLNMGFRPLYLVRISGQVKLIQL